MWLNAASRVTLTWVNEHMHKETLEWTEARRNVAERCSRVTWANKHKHKL